MTTVTSASSCSKARRKLIVFVAAIGSSCGGAGTGRADILRWDTHEIIPGTESSEIGPGLSVPNHTLLYADFADADLSGADFRQATVDKADLSRAVLTNSDLSHASFVDADFDHATLISADLNNARLDRANLSNADLTNADLTKTRLRDANLAGAVVSGVDFGGGTSEWGLTEKQLRTTKSFQQKDLRGIDFAGNDLSGWDFSDQDLTGANLRTNLTDANFTGAIINGAAISPESMTWEQITSTKSYRQRDLSHLDLRYNLDGLDLSEFDFSASILPRNFVGTDFSGATFDAFSPRQLVNVSMNGATNPMVRYRSAYIVQSDFQSANLNQSLFSRGNIVGSDFSDVDLSESAFIHGNIIDTVFVGADLVDVKFKSDLFDVGFRRADLSFAYLVSENMTRVDFQNASLVHATIHTTDLTTTDLRGANLKGATLHSTGAFVDQTTVYDQWTTFPEGFDPESAGLTFEMTAVGDVDANGLLDIGDLDVMSHRIQGRINRGDQRVFDLSDDLLVTVDDLHLLATEILGIPVGDTNLDSNVDFRDFLVLSRNFGMQGDWANGDFDATGEIDFADLLLLANGFAGSSTVASVPEPEISICLVILACLRVRTRKERSIKDRHV